MTPMARMSAVVKTAVTSGCSAARRRPNSRPAAWVVSTAATVAPSHGAPAAAKALRKPS